MISLHFVVLLLLLRIFIGSSQDVLVKTRNATLADVSEDAPIGSEIRNKSACRHSKCDFHISDLYGVHLKRMIDLDRTTGSIKVKSPLDRELLIRSNMCNNDDCVLKFNIIDRLNNEKEVVRLKVLDVNDNQPEFEQETYEIHILENAPIGYRERLPSAKDIDQGDNSKITYYLFDRPTDANSISHTFSFSNLFFVNQGNPSLEVIGPLDYEIQKEYRFRLVAVDNGAPNLRSEINITVIIDDVNDNSPQCTSVKQQVFLREDAKIGDFVGTVSAKDNDSPKYGTLHYSIFSVSPKTEEPLFEIDHQNGSIFLIGKLDYEKSQRYDIDVKVSEVSGGSLPAVCTLVVTIIDVNDNPPIIEISFFDSEQLPNERQIIKVSEDVPLNTQIGEMVIRDSDGTSQNSQFDVEFKCGALRAVAVNKGEYSIVTEQLDREMQSYYECRICATDRYYPFYNTTVKFDVMVLDVNDNKPVADFPSQIDFKEDTLIGSVLVRLRATDKDLYSNITYSLTEKNSGFNLTKSGVLMTTREFDREKNDTCFEVEVVVDDNGHPPMRTSNPLRLCVLDINDNSPSFRIKSYTFKVSENTLPGTVVGKVSARDIDSGDNGRLNFSFCSPLKKRKDTHGFLPFSVDQNGTIRLSEFIDYEDIAMYDTDVCVRDFGYPRILSDRARVRFFVQNANDNNPRFFFKNNVHFVNRDLKHKQPYQFIVKDMDGDRVVVDATISAHFTETMSVSFIRRENNSHIFELFFSEKIPQPGFYTIKLEATDIPSVLGAPMLNSTAYIIFAVGDNTSNRTKILSTAKEQLKEFTKRVMDDGLDSGPMKYLQKILVISTGIFLLSITTLFITMCTLKMRKPRPSLIEPTVKPTIQV
ncbi:hypothetical protein ACOME3_007998 [Neoechinorhynchus agilis]